MAGDGFVEVAPDDPKAIRWQQWYDAHPEEDPRAYEQPPELDDEDNAILDRLWDNMPDNAEAGQVSAAKPKKRARKNQ
jgi:hypothetical protein